MGLLLPPPFLFHNFLLFPLSALEVQKHWKRLLTTRFAKWCSLLVQPWSHEIADSHFMQKLYRWCITEWSLKHPHHTTSNFLEISRSRRRQNFFCSSLVSLRIWCLNMQQKSMRLHRHNLLKWHSPKTNLKVDCGLVLAILVKTSWDWAEPSSS